MMLLSPVSNQTRQERDIDFLCTVQYGHPPERGPSTRVSLPIFYTIEACSVLVDDLELEIILFFIFFFKA
jgi:hypothetical protein